MRVPESLFGRLFRYARSTAIDQLENFTTEALAAAIESDPMPLLAVLERQGLVSSAPRGLQVVVTTQEVVPRVGVLDLVVRTYVDRAPHREIWVEVKAWAPESGDQLARYRRAITQRSDGDRCILLTLGPRSIGDEEAVPWIPWRAIRDVARSPEAGTLWRELAAFLEERGMTDDSSDPITAREAASLLDGHGLFRKAVRVLTEVGEVGLERWPWWGWGNRDQVSQLVLGQFQRHRRYTMATTARPVYLVIGYTDLYASGEAHLTVWVETDPRKPDLRQRVLAAAKELDPAWAQRIDSWQALLRTQRAATIEGVPATLQWFTARLDELEAVGLRPESFASQAAP